MTADPGTVVRRFLECLRGHDADGAIALLSPDFEFRDEAGTFSAGRASMPAMLAWDFEAGSRLKIEALTVKADGARARLRERNRFTDLLGLEPWDLQVRFVVADGRIREEVVDDRGPDGHSTTERFGRAIGPVAQWAGRERPEEAAGRCSRETGRSAMTAPRPGACCDWWRRTSKRVTTRTIDEATAHCL